jgi:hypothetical protein
MKQELTQSTAASGRYEPYSPHSKSVENARRTASLVSLK